MNRRTGQKGVAEESRTADLRITNEAKKFIQNIVKSETLHMSVLADMLYTLTQRRILFECLEYPALGIILVQECESMGQ